MYMIKIKMEDIGSCASATNAIPSKISYTDEIPTNEIYYFGTPPEKPKSLRDYIKSDDNNKSE